MRVYLRERKLVEAAVATLHHHNHAQYSNFHTCVDQSFAYLGAEEILG